MRKLKFVFMFIVLFFFFLCTDNIIKAEQYVISEYPVSEKLTYGEPLFEASLIGGVSSVSGTFNWENENVVLEAGVSNQKVIFTPFNSELEIREIEIAVTVNPRRVFPKFEKSLYKQYDNSTLLKLPAYTVQGIIDKNVYVKGILSANLESAFVGENIKVNLSGLELVGDKKDNYYLDLTGFLANVYPRFIEMFGNVKNRVDFSENTYVPMHAIIHISEPTIDLKQEGHKIIKGYDIQLRNGNEVIDVKDKIKVKIKIENFDGKRISLYNYYNETYEKIDYVYEDGYLIYESHGLGVLVLSKVVIDYTWMFITFGIVLFIVLAVLLTYVSCKMWKNRKKINKYKSIKRRKNDGDY